MSKNWFFAFIYFRGNLNKKVNRENNKKSFLLIIKNISKNNNLLKICTVLCYMYSFALQCLNFIKFVIINLSRGSLILKILEIENEVLKVLWYDSKN